MKNLIIPLLILSTLLSCKKDPPPVIPSAFERGIFCLNEGLFQQNNASISFFQTDSQNISQHIFSKINGRGLGDTANDVILYYFDGHPYYAIAVDVSSQVEIIDALTLKSVKQIGLFDGNSPRAPRAIKYYNSQLLVINFDGTVTIIDLTNYAVLANVSVGLNPESGVVIGDELFCVNSGGLNAPNYDNRISVVDLNSRSVSTTFETDINCSTVLTDQDQEIYLLSRGNYTDLDPKFLRIDPSTRSVTEIHDRNIQHMAYYNQVIYCYDADHSTIIRYNTVTETFDNSVLIDCSNIDNLYGIYIHAKTKRIYLVDANGYVNSSTVLAYDLSGNYQSEFTAGLNTGKLIFTTL